MRKNFDKDLKVFQQIDLVISMVKRQGVFMGCGRYLRHLINKCYSILITRRLDCNIDYTTQMMGTNYIQFQGAFCVGRYGWIEAISVYGTNMMKPTLIIGNNVSLSDFNHIGCANYVKIGNNVLFGSKCYVTDHNHGVYTGGNESSPDIPPIKRLLTSNQSVIIEDNVWIGDNVVILPGVRIGYGSIIGANAVVSRNIPPASIAVGSPARVIKKWDQRAQCWKPIK